MRTIGIFILLLLFGCGFLSFFALERNMMTESVIVEPKIITAISDSAQSTAIPPPAQEEIVTVIVIFTATPQPVNDPLLLTATDIVRQATERVDLATSDPTSYAASEEARRATQEASFATREAVQTAYPDVPIQAIYATQFVLTQAAHPEVSATIESCHFNSSFETPSEPFGNLVTAKLEERKIPMTVEYRVTYHTTDCIYYDIESADLSLIYWSEQLPDFDFNQLADDLSNILLSEDLSSYRVDKFDILIYTYNSDEQGSYLGDEYVEYFYGAVLNFDDFRANYEDGLRGLNLFLPRGD